MIETKGQTLDRYRKMYKATKPEHKWIRELIKKKAKSLKNSPRKNSS